MKNDGQEEVMHIAIIVFKRSAIDSTYSMMRLLNLPMYI